MAGFFVGTAMVSLIGLDSHCGPGCPACPIEHNPGFYSSAFSSSPLVQHLLQPVFHLPLRLPGWKPLGTLEPAPRFFIGICPLT